MTTTSNLILFSIFILGIIFLFRISCLSLDKKYGFRLLFIIYIFLLFFISFFLLFFRIDLVSRLGLYFDDLLSFILVCSVGSGGGQLLLYFQPTTEVKD